MRIGRFVAAIALLSMSVTAAGAARADEDASVFDPAIMAAAQEACRVAPYSVLVSLRKVKSDKGVMVLDLHRDPATFLKKGGKILRIRVPAVKGDIQACVPVPEPGVYAIGLYQDKNQDMKLGKGFLGIPSEPYGVSTDPSFGLSAPAFDKSDFTVEGPLTPVTITVH